MSVIGKQATSQTTRQGELVLTLFTLTHALALLTSDQSLSALYGSGMQVHLPKSLKELTKIVIVLRKKVERASLERGHVE